MITIYLPVFKLQLSARGSDWLIRQRVTCYAQFEDELKPYWWANYETVGSGKTKFLAILDYLKRGSR